LCHRRAARRSSGRRLGALVAPLDHRCLGLPRAGYRAGLLVGLLRAGLGWLVVLGPGGKCLLHALVGRHRADPLAGGDGKTRGLQELDGAAGHRRLLPQPVGHLPGALGRSDLGACVRHRPGAGRLHPRLPAGRRRRAAGSLCGSGPGGQEPDRFRLVVRETFLLINNVILVVATLMVLLGTLYPMALDALTGTMVSVGPPYFNALFVPLMAVL